MKLSATLFFLAALAAPAFAAKNDNPGRGRGNGNGSNKTLNPSVIQKINPASTGPGEAQSLSSDNNFIDFCVGKTITNGQQIKEGSCNPTPMGLIPSTGNMVSSKFIFPQNFGDVPAFQDFEVKMAIKGLQTGSFTNPKGTYYAAPQDLNGQGQIIGHSHFVIEKIDSFTATNVLDPLKFAFFKGVNGKDVNGVLTETVTGGLPPGAYRVSSINASSNHQPVLMPIAGHGSTDDAIYFTVGGASSGGNNNNNNNSGRALKKCRRKRALLPADTA